MKKLLITGLVMASVSGSLVAAAATAPDPKVVKKSIHQKRAPIDAKAKCVSMLKRLDRDHAALDKSIDQYDLVRAKRAAVDTNILIHEMEVAGCFDQSTAKLLVSFTDVKVKMLEKVLLLEKAKQHRLRTI